MRLAALSKRAVTTAAEGAKAADEKFGVEYVRQGPTCSLTTQVMWRSILRKIGWGRAV